MFVTPRIWQRMAAVELTPVLPRTPLKDFLSYPASTPPLPHAGRITIFVEAWSAWARSDGFSAATEEWSAIAERLKLTPCPHCKVVGTLIRHGFLRGFDESNPRRKTLRARRVFCSNRQARPGCGRTFSVWCADKIRRLSLTTGCLWRFLQARRRRLHPRSHPRRRLPSQRPDLAAHLETLRPGPKQDPHGTVGALPAARAAGPVAGEPRTPAGGAGPRPSPGRLPRRRLSHRRLPTCACAPSSCKSVVPLTHRHRDLLTTCSPAQRHRCRHGNVGLATSQHDPAADASMPIVTELPAHFACRLPDRNRRQIANNARCRSWPRLAFAPIDLRPASPHNDNRTGEPS